MMQTHEVNNLAAVALPGGILVFEDGLVTSRASLLSRGSQIIRMKSDRDIPVTADHRERAAQIRRSLALLRSLPG